MTGALALGLLSALGYLCGDPYCRTRVNTGVPNDPTAHCLHWDDEHIVYTQCSAGNPVTGPSVFTSVEKAWASWQAVSNRCGALTLTEGPQTPSHITGYNAAGPNDNLIVFRQTECAALSPQDPCFAQGTCNNDYDCWPYASGTIALTTTTYSTATGQVFDADIELNAADFLFTTVDSPPCVGPQLTSCVSTDVQNTLTHEAGHALGLDHNTQATSTMYNQSPPGETSKRIIDPGSQQFVCDVYPKGSPSEDCVIDPVPVDLGAARSCGCEPGPGGSEGWALLVWLAIAGARRAHPRS